MLQGWAAEREQGRGRSHSQALDLEGEGGETDGGLFQSGAGQQALALALYHHLQHKQRIKNLPEDAEDKENGMRDQISKHFHTDVKIVSFSS